MSKDNRGGVHIEFVNVAVEDKQASAKAGRPIFKDVEHVRVRWVGDNKKELYAPAHEQTMYDRASSRYLTWAEVYAEHYRLFKAQQDQAGVNGTPLSEATFLTEAKRAELRAQNVFTIEGLAGLDGTLLQRLGMGARDMKAQAEAYIAQAAKFAEGSELREANDLMRQENEALKARMARLEAMLERNDVLGDEIRAAAQAERTAKANQPSPFALYADEDIANWIVDNGGEKPHHKCSRETLIRKADELNAAISKAHAA